MKKSINILLTAFCMASLIGCNEKAIESVSKDIEESIISEQSETKNSEEISSIQESSQEEVSSSDELYAKDDSMFERTSLDVGIGDSYLIRYLINSEYKDSWLEIYSENEKIAFCNSDEAIIGLKEGTTTLTIVADEQTYDTITVNVLSDDVFNKTIKMEQGRLQGKSFVVFGDSISDVSNSAYNPKQNFWCEQLADKFDMTMYNYAISGSTTGYTYGLVSRSEDFRYIVGTYVVRKQEVKMACQHSDYAFIYFGNNDCTYQSVVGEIGDIDDSNYITEESFKGSYSYIISKIREYNSSIRIICLGLSYSTWGPTIQYRENFTTYVEDVAQATNAKYIPLFDLWDGTNLNTYCTDGIHPKTAGYELIVDRILNS